ncbi:MAG: tRNA (adenosine(37)-N6)-threonylcarbamoyltransferase complex ATPase subunit type 1 TsaE [Nakamurella sp.]
MTELVLPTADDTHALGEAIGRVLRAGDLVILDGALGAGKTVLTKGIAVGMGVTDLVTSPTFVIARVHQSAARDGVTLVHVDAYRLGGALELDDLDLDTDLEHAAVVIEWGGGRAEQLADDHLLVRLTRHPDDTRTAVLSGTGPRWSTLSAELSDASFVSRNR